MKITPAFFLILATFFGITVLANVATDPATDPVDIAYESLNSRINYWDDKYDMSPANIRLPDTPPPRRRPSYENDAGMTNIGNDNHIGVSFDDARNLATKADGDIIPIGPPSTPFNPKEAASIEKNVGKALDNKYPPMEWDDVADAGGVRAKAGALDAAQNAEPAPWPKDGRPPGDGKIRQIIDTIEKGLGDGPTMPTLQNVQGARPGSVQDRVSKLDANSNPVPGSTRPQQSAPKNVDGNPTIGNVKDRIEQFRNNANSQPSSSQSNSVQGGKTSVKDRIDAYDNMHNSQSTSGQTTPEFTDHTIFTKDQAVEALFSVQRQEERLGKALQAEQEEHYWRAQHQSHTGHWGDKKDDDLLIKQLEAGEASLKIMEEDIKSVGRGIDELEFLTGATLTPERIELSHEMDRLADNKRVFEAENKEVREHILKAVEDKLEKKFRDDYHKGRHWVQCRPWTDKGFSKAQKHEIHKIWSDDNFLTLFPLLPSQGLLPHCAKDANGKEWPWEKPDEEGNYHPETDVYFKKPTHLGGHGNQMRYSTPEQITEKQRMDEEKKAEADRRKHEAEVKNFREFSKMAQDEKHKHDEQMKKAEDEERKHDEQERVNIELAKQKADAAEKKRLDHEKQVHDAAEKKRLDHEKKEHDAEEGKHIDHEKKRLEDEKKQREKEAKKPHTPEKFQSPPIDVEKAKHALNELSQTKHMTDQIANELIASGFDMHPSAQASAEKMGTPANKETSAQGMISGMAALPYLPQAAEFMAEAPEIMELAALAGSPEILAAAGIAMAAPEIAEAAQSLTPLVHTAGGVAVASEEEAAQPAVVSAQLAGVVGQAGVQSIASGTTEVEKAAGSILGGALLASGAALGSTVAGGTAALGGIFGLIHHHHKHHKHDKHQGEGEHETKTEVRIKTATRNRTEKHVQTSVVDHIETVVEGHATRVPAKTVLVTVTSTEKPKAVKNTSKSIPKSTVAPTSHTTIPKKPTSKVKPEKPLSSTSKPIVSSKTPKQTPKIPVVIPVPIPTMSVPKNRTDSAHRSKDYKTKHATSTTHMASIISAHNTTSLAHSTLPIVHPLPTTHGYKNTTSINTHSTTYAGPTYPAIQTFSTMWKNETASTSSLSSMTSALVQTTSTVIGYKKGQAASKTTSSAIPTSSTIQALKTNSETSPSATVKSTSKHRHKKGKPSSLFPTVSAARSVPTTGLSTTEMYKPIASTMLPSSTPSIALPTLTKGIRYLNRTRSHPRRFIL